MERFDYIKTTSPAQLYEMSQKEKINSIVATYSSQASLTRNISAFLLYLPVHLPFTHVQSEERMLVPPARFAK